MTLTAAPRMSAADFDALLERVSNWGRWGPEDQLGTLNTLTPERVTRAAALVQTGERVSLALPLVKEYAADTTHPLTHHMTRLGDVDTVAQRWVMDWFGVACHGYIHSHLDALCHCLYQGRLYNGRTLESVTSDGARELDIAAVAEKGVIARGILFDMPRLRGREWLEPGEPILAEDLDAAERAAGMAMGPGDVLLVRTGRHARRATLGPWNPERDGAAGLHASTAEWLHARDLASLGGDLSTDVLPSGVEGCAEPMHVLTLVAMGLHLFDNLWLDDVAAMCARLGRCEFLFAAAPLRLPGGTGSPLNPIAVF